LSAGIGGLLGAELPEPKLVGHQVGKRAGDRARVGVGGEQARNHLRQHRKEQQHDHGAAHRIVADIVGPPAEQQVPQIDHARHGTFDEIGEAGGGAADTTPDDAEQQQGEDRVARPEVEFHPVAAGPSREIRYRQQNDERPMEQSDGNIPDPDLLVGRLHHSVFLPAGYGDHTQS